jgi:tetratricopeptide (TPR) repeat protein
MHFQTHLTLRIAACLSAAFFSHGCSSSDARARDAMTAYQAAAATNDTVGARKALLELVRAKDDVSEYWADLGKVETSMGDYNGAYYAFSRAYELDRTNVDVLRLVTQLALRAGDIPSARSHAEELSVLAPGDPWPKLVTGWAAITESHFDQALAAADSLLSNTPYDPSATGLKARALIGLGRVPDAIDLLEKQVQEQPSDSGSLQLLNQIYQRQGNWPKVLAVSARLSVLMPGDRDNMLRLIEAGFRSGNVPAARQASLRLLGPSAEPSLISKVLDLWTDYWPSAQRIEDARKLAASAAGLQQRLTYAAFLNHAGSPADALRLSTDAARLPVNAANAEANAVLADGWSRMGNVGAAMSRFGAVLAFDPGNPTALRGRAELEMRTHQGATAVIDAQKLVASLPQSDRDRLLLAQAYASAGNATWADRTLWQAFHDLPRDEKIFTALVQAKKGDAEATRQLQEEFDRERDEAIGRGLI